MPWRAVRLPLLGLLLAVLLAGHELRAAGRFARISVDEGLPSATIYDIRQDRQGFLWFSGATGGLARFDGYEFRFYPLLAPGERHQGLLPDTNALLNDSRDRLWVGTWGQGVSRLEQDRSGVVRYRHDPDDPDSLAGDRVQALFEDRDGAVWVGGTDGLNRIAADGRIERLNRPGGAIEFSDPRVWVIRQAADGSHLIGTADGLYHYDPRRQPAVRVYRLYLPAEAPPRGNEVRTLEPAASGGWWVGGRNGLYHFDPEGGRFRGPLGDAAEAGLGDWAPVSVIRTLEDGSLLFGTQSGLFRYLPDQDRLRPVLDAFADIETLANANVRAIEIDRSGVWWVATRDSGVYRVVPGLQQFRGLASISPAAERASDGREASTTAVFVDRQQRLWLGAADGVQRIDLDSGQASVIRLADERPVPGPIGRFAETPDGTVWIGSEIALFRVAAGGDRAERFERPFSELGLKAASVRGLASAADGRLLIGLWGEGALSWHPQREEARWLLQLTDGVPGNAVFCFAEQSDGRIWLGTRYTGLYRIGPGGEREAHFQFSPAPGALPNNTINDLDIDAEGRLWIASDDGLAWLEGGAHGFRRLDRRHGLPDSKISGVFAAADGAIWALSTRGLSRYQPHVGELVAFTRADGLPASEFNRGAVSYDADGSLYVGTVAGLAAFHPDQISVNRRRPQAAITGVRLDEQPVDPQRGSDGVLQLLMPPGARSLSLQFAALDYQDVGRNQLRYRLVGFDADWVSADRGRYVSYTNLAPGEYRFEVLGSNNHGLWSEQPAQLVVQVLAPWWQLRWVQISLALALIALGYALVRLRLSQLRAGQRRLEHKVAEFAGALKAERDLFVAGPAVAMLWRNAPGWPIDYASGNAADVLGRSPEDLTFHAVSFLSLVHADDRERVRAALEPYRNGQSAIGELRFRALRDGGQERWLLAYVQQAPAVNGEPPALRGYLLDQTGLLQAQDEAEQARRRLMLALEVGGLGIWDWNLQTGKVVFDGMRQRLLGRAGGAVDFGIELFRQTLHPDERDSVIAKIEAHLRGETGEFDCEHRVQHEDGRWIWVHNHGRVMARDGKGRALRVLGIYQDIGTQREARQTIERFKGTLDRALDCVFMFYADCMGFFYANRGALEQAGFEIADLDRRHAWELEVGGSEETLRQRVAPLVRGELHALTYQARHRRCDGVEFPVEVFLQYIAPSGEPARFVAFVRDITERQRIERMKDEFVSTVNHELRTPLTSISGTLGLAVGGALGPLPPTLATLLEVAHRNALQLGQLINDLLDMDKLVAGKLEFDFQPLALMPLVEQSLESNRGYAGSHQVELRLCQRADGTQVRVDALRLQQVLSNLLSNAAKFSPRGGVVELGVHAVGGRVRVEVRDHGPGIPEAFRSRIFQKFSQADSSDRRAKGGTGLGLAISRELMERMQGAIGFTSEAGVGSTFYIELPTWPAVTE